MLNYAVGIKKTGAVMRINNILFLFLVIFLLSTGCAKQQFSPVAKAKTIGDSVFGDEVNVGDNGNNNGGNNNNGENNVGDNGTPNPNPDINFYCSNNVTKNVGYNLKAASKIEIQLIDDAGNIVCRNSDPSIYNTIVTKRIVPITICSAAKADSYHVKLVDTAKSEPVEVKNGKLKKIGKDLININGQEPVIARYKNTYIFRSHKVRVNNKTDDLDLLLDVNDNTSDALCDRRASPLIVKTENEDHKGIQLTSQRDGINFDILGENSDPHAHAKKRISWITKSSYKFLVKPDERGRVRGINELFGDNTKGPDGEFAADGYAALAKYDLNKDQVIDASDAVYSELMLWSDKNFDGIAQKRELSSLADEGLIAIDLQYDNNFTETDKYGNQTKMKSVVKYSDGSYKLIFDLWFNYVGKRSRR